MILQLVLFAAIILLLYFISRSLNNSVYLLLFLLSKNSKFSLNILSLLFLPGTIIHEVAHWIAATILRVPTGELSIFPIINKNRQVQAGKLMIGHTDPFRHTLIGLAPIFSGLTLIYFLGNIFLPDISLSILDASNPVNNYYLLFVICYLLSVLSATMFSSKKDLQSLVIALPVSVLLFASFYAVGVKIYLENDLISSLSELFKQLNYYLLIAAVIDFLVLVIVNLKITVWQKLFKVKITAGESIK